MSTSPDTRPAPLEIPDPAARAAMLALNSAGPFAVHDADVATIVLGVAGPLVVAAELRRQADEIADQVKAMTDFPTLEAEADALTGVMRTLRARADELDPPTGKDER